MENIKQESQNTGISTPTNEEYLKTKSYQDFVNVLSQIIEKYGADTLKDLERVV